MSTKKPNTRVTTVSKIIELSSHLRRIIVTGNSLSNFPIGLEGSYVKVVLPQQGDATPKMRSYTIRTFNPQTKELALDFVINRHEGPATQWARNAKVGDNIGIAGPGPMKMTNHEHHSYLLIGDITSMNALNGYIPRFKKATDVRAIIVVPTRTDIIAMDYDDSISTTWLIEDETTQTLAKTVSTIAADMPKDSHIFIGIEAGEIRTLRPIIQDEMGFDRINISTVGYWKKGIDADRFNTQKRANKR